MTLTSGLIICDYCGGVIKTDDGTPVKLLVGEKLHRYDYHNRKPVDCLSRKLQELRLKFAEQLEIKL